MRARAEDKQVILDLFPEKSVKYKKNKPCGKQRLIQGKVIDEKFKTIMHSLKVNIAWKSLYIMIAEISQRNIMPHIIIVHEGFDTLKSQKASCCNP